MNKLKHPQKQLKQRIEEKANKWRILSTNHIVVMLLVVVGIASAPLQVITHRELVDWAPRIHGYEIEQIKSSSFTLLSRLLNAVIAILFFLLAKRIFGTRIYVTVGVRNLIIALGVFLIFNFGLGSLFGLYPGLPSSPYLMLSIIALMFLALIKEISPQKLIVIFKYVASFMLVGSILIGVLFPEISFGANDSEFIDNTRLVGFFSHPSVIGIFALILFAVELRLEARGWRHLLILLACQVALLMSLSKTAIVLATIFLFWHLWSKGILRFLMAFFVLFATVAYVQLSSGALSGYNTNDENFATLTGRTSLWSTLMDGWSANPWFGNGPAFFTGHVRHIHLAHAHNIILQSISDGGLFGLIGLMGYLFALVSIALKNRLASRSTSIALVLLLLAFSMTEPVMRVNSFLDGPFFINAFVVLYLCALDRQRNSQGKNRLNSLQGQSLVKA